MNSLILPINHTLHEIDYLKVPRAKQGLERAGLSVAKIVHAG